MMTALYIACLSLLVVTFAAASSDPLAEVRQVLMSRRHTIHRRPPGPCHEDFCLHNIRHWLHDPVGFGNAVFDDAATIDAMCSDLQTITGCLSDNDKTCPDPKERHRQLMIGTITGSHGVLCSREGRELLLTERACWESLGARSVIRTCVRAVRDFNPSIACRVADEVRDCILDEVRTTCSQRVVTFLDQFGYAFMKPTADMFQCQIRPPLKEEQDTQDLVGVMRRGLQQLLMMRMP